METIFLIGFPASGKTTIGRELAHLLAREFIDLDALIEHRSRRPVAEIFATEGEPAFRQAERECLAEVLESGAVVATGGGAPCHADNITMMNRAGVTVWLTAPEDVLTRRLCLPEYKQPRPAVRSLTDNEVADYVRRTLAGRTPYYRQAQIHFNATDIETAAATRHTAAQLAKILTAPAKK